MSIIQIRTRHTILAACGSSRRRTTTCAILTRTELSTEYAILTALTRRISAISIATARSATQTRTASATTSATSATRHATAGARQHATRMRMKGFLDMILTASERRIRNFSASETASVTQIEERAARILLTVRAEV